MQNLTPAQMRAIGYQIIDMIVDHHTTLPDKPVTRTGTRAELEPLLREPLPTTGTDFDEILAQLKQDVFTHIMHVNHPRFFAFVPSPSNYVSAVTEALIAGFNAFNGIWLEGAGAAQIEVIVLDWLREACGMPPSSGGIFVSGGSMANITGLAVARHVKLGGPNPDAMVYCSAQTHSSVEKGLRVLGFYPHQLRKVPVGADYRIDVSALKTMVAEDQAAGRQPFCVVANAGTTNTGAIDPLPALADFCEAQNLWLHVDGAYGAAAVLCPRGKALLAGMGRAHSLSLDPHKWLFQPLGMGCLLVREERWMRDTFHILPEYLADTLIDGDEHQLREVNFCDHGIQLTRNLSALKLWVSLKFYGLEAFQEAIEHGFVMTELMETLLRQTPGWEVYTPAQMAVINFRYVPPTLAPEQRNAFQYQLVDAIMTGGFAMIASTVLNGDTVLRACPIHYGTTEDDIRRTVEWLDRLAANLMNEAT
ncbi:MAG: aminotransferase class I/II-fold pyridoxal phosphate-dependent enzyme [Chloroflexota bacterium]